MRLIDGDVLTEKLKQHREYHLDDSQSGVYIAEGISQCIDILNGRESPTVDAVPVVRCGECKHREEKTFWCERVHDFISNPEWFCADGERKEGDE